MSHGGSEGCGAADDGGTGEPFETGGLCVGEEGSTDGNKTSEMTCQSQKMCKMEMCKTQCINKPFHSDLS